MKIAGEDVMFRQCGRCEAKSWLTIDGPLSLTRVLEMAKRRPLTTTTIYRSGGLRRAS